MKKFSILLFFVLSISTSYAATVLCTLSHIDKTQTETLTLSISENDGYQYSKKSLITPDKKHHVSFQMEYYEDKVDGDTVSVSVQENSHVEDDIDYFDFDLKPIDGDVIFRDVVSLGGKKYFNFECSLVKTTKKQKQP